MRFRSEMAIVEEFRNQRATEDWALREGSGKSWFWRRALQEGRTRRGSGSWLGASRVGTNSREIAVSVMRTERVRRLEGGQTDVWPLETEFPLFSKCGLSALKRVTKPLMPHLEDKFLLQILLALHRPYP